MKKAEQYNITYVLITIIIVIAVLFLTACETQAKIIKVGAKEGYSIEKDGINCSCNPDTGQFEAIADWNQEWEYDYKVYCRNQTLYLTFTTTNAPVTGLNYVYQNCEGNTTRLTIK